jgi:uncharacterized protein
LRSRLVVPIAIIQFILFLAHGLIYETWVTFWGYPDATALLVLRATLAVLSLTFVAASLLAFRYTNPPVRAFYRIASVWLGMLNFLFVAACVTWLTFVGARLIGVSVNRPVLVGAFYGLALLAGLYGMINAASIRVKRIRVQLPGLPASWKGRVAALVSDTHLGHIKGRGFVARLVAMLRQLRADVVFIAGDMFDGTKVDSNLAVSPWKQLSPRFGSYFVTGNHEEFSDPSKYLDAIERSGIRVLRGEKVTLDGLQVVGVPFSASANAARFQSALDKAELDRTCASVLLSHAPNALQIAEKNGISLQLSGHTHGGQMFPFTWFTTRVFGEFTYGLQRFGQLLVYTSCGAGTWGPPMRVGTRPEIVLIQFE